MAYLEYRTPAVYHATRQVLAPLDRIQDKFLNDIGVDGVTALMRFNLAPLSARRDMAMLGLIHRTALAKGPRHFGEHFRREGPGKLEDPRFTVGGELLKRLEETSREAISHAVGPANVSQIII